MKTKVVAIGPEDERYAVTIVKTRRRRGCVAEVRNCAAEVRIPHSASYSVGEEFVRAKEQWLLRALRDSHAPTIGSTAFRLWGKDYETEFVVSQRYGYLIEGDKLIVRGPDGKREEALKRVRRAETEKFAAAATAKYAAIMGLETPPVKIVDAKRYLGICYCKRNVIRYSLRLSRFPIEAAEGVVVHELCHLKVPSHSRAFYEEMAKILPDHRARRKLLSQY